MVRIEVVEQPVRFIFKNKFHECLFFTEKEKEEDAVYKSEGELPHHRKNKCNQISIS